ncbi:hypothetical protein COO60DRAFT_881517 [Scenedesmus sp. NREL 46B-D3]|nr:hypothetical protein COO60DRAFT_881517 [Scenedesmus sp. NREL 46B-D3]
MSQTTTILGMVVTILFMGALATAQAARHLTKVEPTRWNKDSKETQGSAYSYSAGNDPGGTGDAFTWYNAEASAASGFNGVLYNDGTVTVEAGDKAKASWVGAFSKNAPSNDHVGGTNYAVAANLDAEGVFQRGVHTVAGTYQGARAVAGSGSMYGMAKDGVSTATIDSYAPAAQDNVATHDRKRSVSVTNIAPTSSAQSGIGNGPAAIASGHEVASAARAARSKTAPVTIGSRGPGDAGYERQQRMHAFRRSDRRTNRRLHRHSMLLRGKGKQTDTAAVS